ncbi:uncharacterized protein LOC117648373 [Thrips palmi]|uniref:Uncharacterized protein LOC117648373 n=1 Tax=Thrips palmi TaxID=161013 RepID=A0A6P8Z2Q8_THRPL|nr:uncharacterized protein LOC117648373 [Thrips palmi]XP_034246767.1 uncharacterized protein LOC117648373 [Thrips palmi]XP_034246768.1 uncharacterized protein LOC117648373 [Thrips palmi]XP_034246769.1 uncharacterized protein LOC117648373 [Thrips palmi]XP_034246771.1 uncharacterized protein LOC117648373 [Thrips palmi]XP_034246772.1 uncharacterized protein LOC117648373 [Thrips palmi]XP_034246773.1 uncharacterized protein LOC117648373 [Thrips palmi]XP_034246774.1 uncharacterized protein LOC1176
MECPVCFEAFDPEVRRPKTLPCGHTFCLSCLRNPDFGDECPQDRKAFRGEPVHFPDNFALLSLLSEMPTRAEAVWCEVCSRHFSGECADAGHQPCSMRRKRARLEPRQGPGVAELQHSVQELQRELQEMRRAQQQLERKVEDSCTVAPPPRQELDVSDMSTEANLRKERNDLLLGGRLAQVRKLTGLHCETDADWGEAVLQQVGPHVVELEAENADLRHLRVIAGMPALRKLELQCAANVQGPGDVPLLPLQLEELHLRDFALGHLTSLQWMPKLRRLLLESYDDHALDFTRAPDHCGLQWLSAGFGSTRTILSLVRANAATLQELHVHCGSRRGLCFREDLANRLFRCGAGALRRITVYRNDLQHERRSCRQQMASFRERFGANVDVRCSLCGAE